MQSRIQIQVKVKLFQKFNYRTNKNKIRITNNNESTAKQSREILLKNTYHSDKIQTQYTKGFCTCTNICVHIGLAKPFLPSEGNRRPCGVISK